MLNVLEIQDNLKNFSQDQLVSEMQSPSGQAPQFLVLSELSRRERMKQDLNKRMSQDEPTVAEESIVAAGFPQGGIMDMARSLSPKSSIAQNTGINSLPMKTGGVIKAQNGLPLGIRNFNPGNLRKPSGDPFFGTSGMDSGYLTFSDPNYGLRALARNLMTYQDEYGIDNVNSLVDRYAPPSDNPEKSRENYKLALSNILGINPDEQFNIRERMPQLMEGIIKFENKNQMPYSSDQLSTAIDSASIDDELKVANMLLEKPNVPMPKPKNLSNNRGINQDFDNFSGNVKREPSIFNKLGIVSSAEAATSQNNSTAKTKYPDPASDLKTITAHENLAKGDGSATLFIDPEDNTTYILTGGVDQGIVFNPSLMPEDYVAPAPANPTNEQLNNIDAAGQLIDPITEGMLTREKYFNQPKETLEKAQILSGEIDDQSYPDEKFINNFDETEYNKMLDRIKKSNQDSTNNQTSNNNNNTDNKVNELLTTPISKSGTSSLEQQILDLMERRTKSAEADKWLALAQAGLAIMSSDKPTLGGAIGEGGLVGLQAMADANARYEEGLVDLINAQAKLNKASPDLNKVRQRYMDVMKLLGQAQLPDDALNLDQKINLTDAQIENLKSLALNLQNQLFPFDARD